MVSEFIQESLDHLLSGHTLVRGGLDVIWSQNVIINVCVCGVGVGGMLRDYIGCDIVSKCDYKWCIVITLQIDFVSIELYQTLK
jgi:hypothetical protein